MAQVLERTRLEHHVRRIALLGKRLPFLDDALGALVQAKVLDGEIGPELEPENGNHFAKLIGKGNAAFGEKHAIDLVPNPHGIRKRAIEIEYDGIDISHPNLHELPSCSICRRKARGGSMTHPL